MSPRSRLSSGPLLVLCLFAAHACGHRGEPRPPVYPQPPAAEGLVVSQRGTSAILRFPLPDPATRVGDEIAEIASIEILVYAERYPVFEPPMMVAALERQRDLYVEEALAAAELAAAATNENSEAEEQAAAGVANRAAAGREGAGRMLLNPEEELLRRVPPAMLRDWRRSGLAADTILEAARQLSESITSLWERLSLPKAVIDPQRPPRLPDAAVIAGPAAEILAGLSYEREVQWERFLQRSSPVYRFPFEEAEKYRVGELLQLAHPVGIASPGQIRTRYFFAQRSTSKRGRLGEVRSIVALAPEPVPLPPGSPSAALTEPAQPVVASVLLPVVIDLPSTPDPGVELKWSAPPGDSWGRMLATDSIGYNIYRGLRGEPLGPEPINSTPITGESHTDRSMEWGQSYAYEIRAVELSAAGPIHRESSGARTDPVEVIDTFPPGPPNNLQVARAGSQVTLRWDPSPANDLTGYRVYRHPTPAPPLPDRRPRYEGSGPGAAEGVVGAGGRRRPESEPAEQEAPNPMREAGWELLTPEPILSTSFIDSAAREEARYVYAIEAVDQAGNLSPVISEGEQGGPRG